MFSLKIDEFSGSCPVLTKYLPKKTGHEDESINFFKEKVTWPQFGCPQRFPWLKADIQTVEFQELRSQLWEGRKSLGSQFLSYLLELSGQTIRK